ncbi:glutaredoxin family protein [Kangiella sediminilitoris]|uniref:Glutaredoxin 2 n=1 Tax=Kangiella sediminilitoris TaxID=1144748 RepID=A0A1B3B9C5_9GAMM|nr:glutaredoxin family protein [Kangiella sediminilitoris]AOE49403.1 Glutaredoxin 2 [Kangiella sediminilitoris]
MQKKQEIILYTTFGCHLCEQVEAMIFTLNQQKNLTQKYNIIAFDIIDDEKILEEYRTTIPVLKNQATNEQLFWPFTFEQLNDWLT